MWYRSSRRQIILIIAEYEITEYDIAEKDMNLPGEQSWPWRGGIPVHVFHEHGADTV